MVQDSHLMRCVEQGERVGRGPFNLCPRTWDSVPLLQLQKSSLGHHLSASMFLCVSSREAYTPGEAGCTEGGTEAQRRSLGFSLLTPSQEVSPPAREKQFIGPNVQWDEDQWNGKQIKGKGRGIRWQIWRLRVGWVFKVTHWGCAELGWKPAAEFVCTMAPVWSLWILCHWTLSWYQLPLGTWGSRGF